MFFKYETNSMKTGDKLYMISNLNICAEIINEKVMNNLTHYKLFIEERLKVEAV